MIAHRGEHLVRPENTIPAFAEAIRLGADFIEVDVRTTADGQLVLSHDTTVDRCTNGRGRISEMTFEQVRALDAGAKKGPEFAGAKIPTFDEVLDLARGRTGIYVDAKAVSAKVLVRHIEQGGMAGNVVMYCGQSLAREILAVNPNLKVMPEANSLQETKQSLAELHPTVIAFADRDFKPEIVAAARQGGALIYVDRLGLNDGPGGWQAAIEAGADGIQTDRPGQLVEFLRSQGYR